MDSSVEGRVHLTPVDRENLRKSQYKSGKSSTTPEWRSSYRMVGLTGVSIFKTKFCFVSQAFWNLVVQRCKERLTKSRERLISRFRKLDGEPGSSPDQCIRKVESSSPGSMATGICEPPQPAASGHMDTEDPVSVLELSIKEAMMEEWEQMRTENVELPSLSTSRKRVVPFPDMADLETPRRKSLYLSSFCSSDDEFDVSYESSPPSLPSSIFIFNIFQAIFVMLCYVHV